MNEHLKIDEEFRTIIPPLTAEEYGNLERSLRMEGCRDAIRVWDGVIVDGHNRYEICRRWNIPYNVIQISFTSREAAISWICLNQLSRRNLTREAYKYLIGKRYDAEKSVLRNTTGRNQYSTNDTLESAVAQKHPDASQKSTILLMRQSSGMASSAVLSTKSKVKSQVFCHLCYLAGAEYHSAICLH